MVERVAATVAVGNAEGNTTPEAARMDVLVEVGRAFGSSDDVREPIDFFSRFLCLLQSENNAKLFENPLRATCCLHES
jgi:hypothetical protein